ncbi:membrane bound O-acyl transferase family-domain-containing protein [Sporodiniella umbellata]|nr:membrane bound O-acyl transferase family-domain-containing protein [Sporodiniella umbellata]
MGYEWILLASVLPALLFMVISIPVKERRWAQEGVLGLLWMLGLGVPLWYAGKVGFVAQMSSAVWSWGTGMKMGVWLFSMTMEERRQLPFVLTVLSWRSERQAGQARAICLGDFVWDMIHHVAWTDLTESLIHASNVQLPVRMLSAFCARYLGLGTMPADFRFSLGDGLQSTATCCLFAVYLQKQMELTYDAFMILFVLLHRALRPGQAQAFVEGMIRMPAAFDHPWSAHSLRDFWGRRWHTYYNECFYRLGYQPIRTLYRLLRGPQASPPRGLPALAVFTMSGIMHEYFLYAANGPHTYFAGTPLPRGGFQLVFFLSQMLFIAISDRYIPHGRPQTLFAFLAMLLTCHLFVVPYFMCNYLIMPRLSFIRIVHHLSQGRFCLLDAIDTVT